MIVRVQCDRRQCVAECPLMVPEYLRVGSGLLLSDPVEWHRQRLTWFRAHLDKLRQSLSPLEFLLETREASRQAPGPPTLTLRSQLNSDIRRALWWLTFCIQRRGGPILRFNICGLWS